MRIPRATYRLQFNRDFRLADALALAPYLHDLGISHIYCSPLFKASPGSAHGYDVCDFNELNPEIGTEKDLEHLADALHAWKMGLVLDIVPNHMGIASPANRWWWDILAKGKQSRFAGHFDIDWEPAERELHGKILVPILGDSYEMLLERGELKLLHEEDEWRLGYHEHRFPIASRTIPKDMPQNGEGLRKFNSDAGALDQLIQKQHYRLAFHREGDAKVNYRRFFAVSTLAAVRVEDEETFNATHALLQRWLKRGWVDGLRVDHPDGLREPGKYLRQLRKIAPDAWIVVEKILGSNELLPKDWPVQGTTGYDFLNQVNSLFIDAESEKAFAEFYALFTGEKTDYTTLVTEKKRLIQGTLLVSELNRLTGLLGTIALRDKAARNFPRVQLREALAEVIACFPVYRSYVSDADIADAADVAAIKFAVQLACENRRDLPPEIFAFLHALLVTPPPGTAARHFVARLQQLTGAVMAKGAEDTAFYCFNRFISQNEVGSAPKQFGISPADFHHFIQRHGDAWPHSQLTTSTHDTKRAEDVRARLNVLSEIPDLWMQTVLRWSAMNARHREDNFPDLNAEYLYYQTLAGAWPISEERIQAYMEKASHEAKQHTDWTMPNEAYERALKKFIAETLRDTEFTRDLEHFVGELAEAAAVNSLAQTLIKLTAPGVPDIYQGCELWDFSLVDPDNRRPVDFGRHKKLLRQARAMPAQEAWAERHEGLPKLWLIQKTLMMRARTADFAELDYEPAHASGPRKEHVAAFSRGNKIMTVVPRFILKLKGDWQDTTLDLRGAWQNELTGEMHGGKTGLEAMFKKFPVALLIRKENN